MGVSLTLQNEHLIKGSIRGYYTHTHTHTDLKTSIPKDTHTHTHLFLDRRLSSGAARICPAES